MKILCIETSSIACSAAVLEDEKILGEYFINNKLVHSKTFMPMVESLFKTLAITPDDIGAIAVSAGPGSFTGLRIGIAAAKGIAAKKNIPCIAVSSLECCAYNMAGFDGIICPVMDARREQVYNAFFECENGKLARLCEDRAIQITDLEKELKKYKNKNIFLVGDGADICYNTFEKSENIHLAAPNLLYQRASGAGYAALKAINNNKTIKSSDLAPIYLKMPQAQRELLEKQNSKSVKREENK